VLANPLAPNVGGNQVIRVFARALYHIAGNATRRFRTGKSRSAPFNKKI